MQSYWWSLAPMNSLRDNVPLVPGLRTESPQPVSSTRRRLSTDEMQLREVGKLAMYLWKMWWLQRSSHWAQLWVALLQWLIPLWVAPAVCEGTSATRTCLSAVGGGASAPPIPMSTE